MPLSWNEIKSRAVAFSREWAEETREDAEAKSFWDAFFNVFGISRRLVAIFEEPVRSLKDTYNFIDLFWKGVLLAEHKSAGRDLEKAKGQAFDYIQDLAREGRTQDSPRYVIVSNFARVHLYDLEAADQLVADFPLKEFHRHIKHFAFFAGYKQHSFEEEPSVNIKAAELMANLCDTLEDAGYPDHYRQVFLVRLLFCLFANDTGIFDSKAFDLLVEESASDGKDLGPRIAVFFDTLNIPREKRQTTLDEMLAGLPYVNGGLFAASLPVAHFNTAMHDALLDATRFDWSRISPAVFGALFQGVMEPRARRQIGAHYTSEANILKVIRPLFLNGLQDELKKAGTNHAALNRLHDKIAGLKFLDPACGCGNFLVISYREIRAIENNLLAALHHGHHIIDISHLALVDVDQFYGIEIDEWPARIAEVAMWLMDHQMNCDLAEKLGQYFVRLPLKKSPHIHQVNALRTDWAKLLPPNECSYVMGNPPFVGSRMKNEEQKQEIHDLFTATKDCGDLDYVTCWYLKAAQYIQGTKIECAFVSTNSITQGLQVGILWQALDPYKLCLNFAHRTFAWQSEARGKAHVHVVILGFSTIERAAKLLFDYEDILGEPLALVVKSISPYLLDAPFVYVTRQITPICPAPNIFFGNMPIDGGNYLFSATEKDELIIKEPPAAQYFRLYVGAEEFLNGKIRYCLWLKDASPVELRKCPTILQRIQKVRDLRLKSTAKATRQKAETPQLFFFISHPESSYILIPGVSSERRKYVPIGFMSKETIASNLVHIIPNASLYHFGVLSSAMHMAWMRQVAGRLKSDYRYSGNVVYNNFPWPDKVSDERRKGIERCAQAVIDERAKHQAKGATLADLYNPITMPPGLAKAHAALDRAVDRAYRSAPFISERARVEHLFGLYQALTTLFPEKPKKRTQKNAATPATSSE
ncbi:MAG: class I SAM-dependent DNA methyltransferase [Spartobacteria bacterium]|nr:class I SAM-dependent DNA methyltransferase [Spartobacteria bacterium]